jgi:hypothetical protein
VYASSYIFRVIKSIRKRWAGHVTRTRERSAYRALVWKPDGRRQLGRHRHRRKDTIGIVLQEVRGDVNLTGLAQNCDIW